MHGSLHEHELQLHFLLDLIPKLSPKLSPPLEDPYFQKQSSNSTFLGSFLLLYISFDLYVYSISLSCPCIWMQTVYSSHCIFNYLYAAGFWYYILTFRSYILLYKMYIHAFIFPSILCFQLLLYFIAHGVVAY